MGAFDFLKRLFGGSQQKGTGIRQPLQHSNAQYEFSRELRNCINYTKQIESLLERISGTILEATSPKADAGRIASDIGTVRTWIGQVVSISQNLGESGGIIMGLANAVFVDSHDKTNARGLIDTIRQFAHSIPTGLNGFINSLTSAENAQDKKASLSTCLLNLRNVKDRLKDTKRAEEALTQLVDRHFLEDHK